jgi:hypothetical protein
MSAHSPFISSRITHPLEEVSQRQWTVLAARGIFQTLGAALAVLLGVSLLLGWLEGMPVAVRIALAAVTWAIVLWSAVHCLRPALRRWSLNRAAQMAESTLPDAQERISSAIELSQTEDQFRGSPELVAHLMQQAEADASRVNVATVIPLRSMWLWLLAFVPVLVVWTVLALNAHTGKLLLRGLFTAFTPWKGTPAAFADISVKPGDVILAQGDPLVIAVTLSPNGGKPAKSANVIRISPSGQSTSEALNQVGGTEFSRTFDDLQQSFRYQIHTDGRDSSIYSVTVNPRPSVARLDVRYDFPRYTGIDAITQTGSDGNIEALVGTKATLTLTTIDPLVSDKSHLVFNDGHAEPTIIPLKPTVQKNIYTASFDITQNAEYSIKLMNEHNLANKDDNVRAITAKLDEPPTIAIQLPKEQITVRPDDNVSVMYVAGDDYGVAHIDALVQVDDKPERSMPVIIHGKNRRSLHEQWMLSIPAILALEGNANATRITYQLKATDNRDPDPQTALSNRQTLIVDKHKDQSFQDTLNKLRKEDLQSAIKKAIDRLNRDLGPIASVRDLASRRALDAQQTRTAGAVCESLCKTALDLIATTDEYLNTPFAQVAAAAKSIADNGITQSADAMSHVLLDNGNSELARADGDKSYSEAVRARDDLQRLLEKVDEAERKAEAAQELKDAAKKQADVAKAMAEHPEDVDKNRQMQQDAINKLQEAMRNDPTLQDQKAEQLARAQADLENKIEQEQQKQTDLQNQSAKQEQQQQAEKQANALADEQKKLNEKVEQFAKDDKKALDQARAQTPSENQQNQLVQNIEKNELKSAAEQAQQAADQLKQDAQKLADQAHDANPSPNADQQKQQEKDKQNAQDAKNAQDQANQAADQLKNQANQQQQNADANKQDAQNTEKAADAIAKAADKVEQQNQDGAKNADVQKAAEAAKADAQQAAADAQAAAADQNPQDAAKAEAKAAQELAQAGQELNQAAQAEAKADQAQAQQENQQAAAKAADQAQALAKDQQQIAQSLQQQAQQQADAQQQGAKNPQQSAQQQQQLAQQTQQEQQAAQQLAQQAQAQQDAALAQRAEQAAQALADAQKDQQQAAQAEAQGKPADAAQAQADAQQALGKADQALRGNPEQAQADAQQGQPGQGQPQPGQGQPQPGQGQPQPGQPTPQQSAAQAAQHAAQAQQQALQPSPAAAADAAQALAQAAQAAQQALPGQPGQPGDPSQADGQPGTDPGQEPGKIPGIADEPNTGIVGSDTGGDNKVPDSVAALGINSNDWVKLPTPMQQELLNTSQQSSPPAYREMIKNYYIRTARAQSGRSEATQKQ